MKGVMLWRKYRGPFSGALAFSVQRVTGLLLLGYLFVHVWTIRKLGEGPEVFDAAMAFFRHPLFKLLEIGLLATVILHALNGVRITLVDLGLVRRQREWFWYFALGLGLLIFALGAAPIFWYSVLGLE